MLLGFWVLIGIISFVICEKLVVFANSEGGDDDDDAHVDVGVEEEENFETEINISDSSNNNVEKKVKPVANGKPAGGQFPPEEEPSSSSKSSSSHQNKHVRRA